jgi:hypothetical protein
LKKTICIVMSIQSFTSKWLFIIQYSLKLNKHGVEIEQYQFLWCQDHHNLKTNRVCELGFMNAKTKMLSSNSISYIRQSDILKLKISFYDFINLSIWPTRVYFWLPNFKHIMDKLHIIPIFLNIGKVTKAITIYCHNSECFQIQFHDSIFINITLGKYVEVIYMSLFILMGAHKLWKI